MERCQLSLEDMQHLILSQSEWWLYSLSGSSWSGGSACEGWDWTESTRLQSPQMHCSSQTQKSRGLHTGSTPWWSRCRWMQSGPKSRKKIGNIHVCVYLAHIHGHYVPATHKCGSTTSNIYSHGLSLSGMWLIQFLHKNRYRGLNKRIKFLMRITKPAPPYTETILVQCGSWEEAERNIPAMFLVLALL